MSIAPTLVVIKRHEFACFSSAVAAAATAVNVLAIIHWLGWFTRGGSAAVGPGAVATSTSADVSWWWYVLAAGMGAASWEVITHRVVPTPWMPCRTH